MLVNGIGEELPDEGSEKRVMCCLCNKAIIGHGHNPAPLERLPKLACDDCNMKKVLPARYSNKPKYPSDGSMLKWLQNNYPPMHEYKRNYNAGDA